MTNVWRIAIGAYLIAVLILSIVHFELRPGARAQALQAGCGLDKGACCKCPDTGKWHESNEQTLDALLGQIQKLPTSSLTSYRSQVQHWELCRELLWQRSAQEHSSQVGRDLDTLTLAVYLRSLPSPVFSRAWRDGIIDAGEVADPRVKALLLTFYASDSNQLEGRNLGDALSHVASGKAIRRQVLDRAKSLDESYFYSTAAGIVGEVQDIRSAYLDTQGLGAKNPARLNEAHKSLKLAVGSYLQSRLSSYLPDEAPQLRSLMTLDEVSVADLFLPRIDKYDLVVLGVYYNNWLDIECWLKVADKKRNTATVALDNIRRVRNELRGRNDPAIPPDLLASLCITQLEYAAHTTLTAANVRGELTRALAELHLLQQDRLDPYESRFFLGYVRSESVHLKPLVSPSLFDSCLAQVRK